MNVFWLGHRLGIALLALTAIEPLGALWWWALFGMSKEVATAHIFTPFVLFGAGCGLVIACDSPGPFRVPDSSSSSEEANRG